jgi:hypothetical protein
MCVHMQGRKELAMRWFAFRKGDRATQRQVMAIYTCVYICLYVCMQYMPFILTHGECIQLRSGLYLYSCVQEER